MQTLSPAADLERVPPVRLRCDTARRQGIASPPDA
jgi:hypothetical protein